jgi:hypothetical protein
VKPGAEVYPAAIIGVGALTMEDAAFAALLASPTTWGVILVGGVLVAVIVVASSSEAYLGQPAMTWDEVNYYGSQGRSGVVAMSRNPEGEYTGAKTKMDRYDLDNCPIKIQHLCEDRGGDPCNRLNSAKAAAGLAMASCWVGDAKRVVIQFAGGQIGLWNGSYPIHSTFWEDRVPDGFAQVGKKKASCTDAYNKLQEMARLAKEVKCP